MCTYRFVLNLSCVALLTGLMAGQAFATGQTVQKSSSNIQNNLAPNIDTPPFQQPDGNWVLDSYFDFHYEVDFDSVGGPVTLTGPGTGHLRGTAPPSADGMLLFDAEMLSYDLAGGPFFAVRESPTLPSLGQTRITSDPDGTFRIRSFFDIFVELSHDGGQTWTPDPVPWSVQSVPEPSTVLLGGLAAGLLALSRRRRRVAPR